MKSSAEAAAAGHERSQKDSCETRFPATKHITAGRSPSLSSSSSLSSCSTSNILDDSLSSPATSLRFSGVPFSWEQLPGIPKMQLLHKKKDSTAVKNVLPLPPPATPPTSKRFSLDHMGKKISSNEIKDPFVAALVECSKDDDDDDDDQSSTTTTGDLWSGRKITRSISDRFAFINFYTSCKRTCAVSESIINLPRSNTPSYDLITRRTR